MVKGMVRSYSATLTILLSPSRGKIAVWMKQKRTWIVVTLSVIALCVFRVSRKQPMFMADENGCGADLKGVKCQDAVYSRSILSKEWSFQKTVLCPSNFFSIENFPVKRQIISTHCDNKTARILSRTTRENNDIFSVPFGDMCLQQVIENSCLENRTVPNVVHYVWYNEHRMDFFNFISFMSAVKFVKPCLILIHGQYIPFGIYWDLFVRYFPNVIHVKRDLVKTVGNNILAFAEHGSDVMRIQALNLYGGVYLDWDEVVLRSVDKLRDFPMTMGVEKPYLMGSQFIMARKGAPFLSLWYRSYEIDYRRHWTYNALEVPFELARQNPDLIHVEGNRFTRPNFQTLHLIFNKNYDWSDNYAMHLFTRWYKEDFDETKIGMLNTTIGSVSRHVLYGSKELCKRS